jgi:diaminohydroxyphosphoribosylaminopyrimidine deaminase / 5-amino-6-(5-phosphoribosylamino)uracil reductase
LRLPSSLNLFDGHSRTIVFNCLKHEETQDIFFYQIPRDGNLVNHIVHALYKLQIMSVIVEGGARLIQSFIDAGIWDEARVITNESLWCPGGLEAPKLSEANQTCQKTYFSDSLQYFEKR